ncbi:MAG: hypothetical protein A2268_03400 [Candidatus Raymondbacteria bacterium RifOxyA12_full_50_37]|nr:MAG: hypothetical protein A2268_03400 [Candidatus Raymondbacteria bacterium RifOxyA12_full_50_37]OGJ87484.1 MAG: hypothetical protein A2248_22140 [Candidatus Raymondbacteria bacterium RIFOXYA2_FULL_49_16]OGJ94888.1 MAG: hypothetical protein A2487_11420 [Candidatus Raymondbacteria bacterium RifOxyC12_full_50_8]OGJ96424.1 MAG: hypothetical protein A2453_01755 [Candidatus Raymondbacteria bacterium RIFOXYC2_FULL_50_21]OGJ99561.1 MAG: hypothetical protein A2350_10065 [Candidatus Raymondbacteria b
MYSILPFICLTIIFLECSFSFNVSGITSSGASYYLDEYLNPTDRNDPDITYLFYPFMNYIQIYVEDDGSRSLTTTDIQNVTQLACAEWATTGYFNFWDVIIQNVDPIVSSGTDRQLTIAFDADGYIDGQELPIAETFPNFNTMWMSKGQLYCDIILNDTYTFSLTTMNQAANIIDYQSVITHELGHLLGAGHSDINQNDVSNFSDLPTMADPGEPENTSMRTTTIARTISADDINCMRFLYGKLYVPKMYASLYNAAQAAIGVQDIYASENVVLDAGNLILTDNVNVTIEDNLAIDLDIFYLKCGLNGTITFRK